MTIEFVTADGERVWADVRKDDRAVRPVVSVQSDGDYDVLLGPETALVLASALLDAAEGPDAK